MRVQRLHLGLSHRHQLNQLLIVFHIFQPLLWDLKPTVVVQFLIDHFLTRIAEVTLLWVKRLVNFRSTVIAGLHNTLPAT